ncbi:MAG TPA: 23S rRNA (adenine(2030)-N(6))-methyltransferase RlmJ [Rhizomicrobium sp.]
MNYRHAYHAGNFADVHKHVALVAVLQNLRRKEKPFAVVDTHAGAALYDLSGTEASKTGEAAAGIAKLRSLTARTPALRQYLEIVNSFGPEHYPGSPLIAAKLLRPQDRLIAMEQHPEEFAALERSLSPFHNARSVAGDGYKQLDSLLPPAARRGAVFIDPPYEEENEMERLARALARAFRRFANGTYIVWHPLKRASDVELLAGELQTAGPMKLLSLTIDVGEENPALVERLHAAGLLVINPPFGLDLEMEAAGAEVLPFLQQGPAARTTVRWLSAER